MKCTAVISLLSEYLDGSLDDAMQKQVEKHLNECSACQNQLSLLVNSMKILRAAVRMKPLKRTYQGAKK